MRKAVVIYRGCPREREAEDRASQKLKGILKKFLTKQVGCDKLLQVHSESENETVPCKLNNEKTN